MDKKKKTSKPEPKAKPAKKSGSPKKDFLVVGLGASAGGVQALQNFFGTMPPNSGMVFVVILHLSPDHESSLTEIIQARTTMPVTMVNENHKVEPNNVYVIPPNRQLEMVDGVIRSTDLMGARGTRVAIDVFFRTLAEAYDKNAVCVVLSGTGTDGTLGLKAVKEANGFAIVQDPEDAEYDSMPRSAIQTQLVDWILPVSQMPEKLIQFRDSSVRLHLTDEDGDGKIGKEIQADESLREILTVLRVRTGHDFSNYKTPTLIRRIARHLQIHDLEDIPAYLDFLREKPDEIHSLLKNLLINVTNFFRDPGAWAVLQRDVVPNLFAGKKATDTVRVWSCGCASGEEAYSLAMILTEYAYSLPDPPRIQVFATDVDEDAIAEAREHRYPMSIEADVSPERLKRFFVKEGRYYRVKKELRETVLFAPHNVLRDPPFSKLDLVACRNLLIYLNRDTQERVMEIFHFALSPNGCLFLGSSETAEAVPQLFATFDKKLRLYTRRPAAQHQPAPQMPVAGRWEIRIPEINIEKKGSRPFSFGEIHHKLLEQYAPPSVLVDHHFDIQYLSESAGRFLRLRGGEPTNNLLKLINPDLLPDLRTALFAAQREKKSVEFSNIHALIDGEEVAINIIVRAVEIENETSDYLLVIFAEVRKIHLPPEGEAEQSRPAVREDAMESVVLRLEEELSRTKEHLRSTIEQHEVSVEELKASNEELQAINEELRSTTEELETSKEELQSVNEELTTVNHELKEKMDETTRTNSDLQNLMASTDIATIFLDRDFRIKRFTSPVEQLFNVTTADMGRPLEHFTHRLDYPSLVEDASEVLRKLTPLEREIRDNQKRVYLTRFVPYRTVDDRIEGVVLNFVDITERKRAEIIVEEDLRDTQILHELAVQSVSDGNIQTLYDKIVEAAVAVTRADAGTVQLYDEKTRELLLLSAKNFPPAIAEHFARLDANSKTPCGIALMNGERAYIEFDSKIIKDTDGSLQMHLEIGLLSAQTTPLISRAGKIIGIFTTHWREHHQLNQREMRFLDLLARQAADLIVQRLSEEELRESEEKYRTLFDSIDEGFCIIEMIFDDAGRPVDFRYVEVNDGFKRQTGREPKPGQTMREVFPEAADMWLDTYAEVLRTGISTRFVDFNEGLGRWYEVYVFPTSAPGEQMQLAALFRNVTDTKRGEDTLRASEALLQKAISIDTVGVLFYSLDGTIFNMNETFARMVGYTREELLGGLDWHYLTPPEFAGVTQKAASELAARGETAPYEKQLVRKDGSRFWGLSAPTRISGEGVSAQCVEFIIDISDRRRSEQAIRKSEERMRIAIEAAELATWEWDFENNLFHWNERHFTLFAMRPRKKPVTPDDLFRRVHPNDRERLKNELQTALANNTVFDSEFCVIRQDGATRWMRGYGQVTDVSTEGTALRMSGVMFDITERKEAEESLRKSEEQLNLILESTKDYAIITFDLKGHITRWNAGAEKIFGYTEKQAVGETTHLIFTPEDIAAKEPERELKSTLKNGRAEDERWHVRKDGSRFFASGVMQLLRDGELEGFVKICRDQTAKLEAEQSAIEREMLRRLVSAQEDERRRIARDIHDHFGQQITALRLKLDAIKKSAGDNKGLIKHTDDAQDAAAALDANVDFIAWELRPAVLDDLGLRTALANFVSEWSNHTGIPAEFHAAGIGRTRLAYEIETNLYRIAQEALNNILKHAQAARVSVLLEKSRNMVSLIIEDDGVGFNVKDKANRKKGQKVLDLKL